MHDGHGPADVAVAASTLFDQPGTTCEVEWLEADGMGGFASGTACGLRTRRYHALLLSAVRPPTGRMVLVNGVEAWLDGPGGHVPLTSQRYAPDVIFPDARQHMVRFTADPWPCWTFRLPDGGMMEHSLFVAADSGEAVLRWRCAGSTQPWRLSVRPLLSGRGYHALHRENAQFDFRGSVTGGNVSWRPYPGLPAISALTNGTYEAAPEWYRNFLYTEEQNRGLDAIEDLAAPGVFSFPLGAGDAVMVLRAGDGLGVRPAAYAESLSAIERARRTIAGPPHAVSASSYIVDRGPGRTIIAGFPWFTDWGRDSFIAMRGLALGTGRLRAAKAILLEWAGTVSEGMLPNRFPDDGGAPEFNSVDASLWYIVAVHDYLGTAPDDPATRHVLGAAVQAILEGYASGTRFGIAADIDGLLRAGVPGMQLTWMDAISAGRVVTPRIGKPVEVQALWINALRIGQIWAPRWSSLEAQARRAFAARFPVSPGGGLHDVVDADHVSGRTDATIRPNQIFAVGGLPFPIMDGAAARAIVDQVEAHLLTPMGLRTLAPSDPAYEPHYRGGPAERDRAYHQGTAWPWLLGPFVEAWLRVRDDTPDARAEAKQRFLAPLLAHLENAGIGHISEIADGDAPHTPRGCPFQAWSLGELIRICRMLDPPSSPQDHSR